MTRRPRGASVHRVTSLSPITPSGAPAVRSLYDWWRELFGQAADAALIDAGHEGELLVARVRYWTFVAVLFSPLLTLLNEPDRLENYIALVAAGAGLVVAKLILRALEQGRVIRRVALITTVFDVTLVSLTQVLYLVEGLPSVAANSRTTFLAYFVAIACTCLRWDARLCLLAGFLAVAEYLGIALWASVAWPASTADPAYLSVVTHGTFLWGQQAGRVVFLIAFTILCLAIIQQSMRLRFSSTHDALTRLMNREYFEERLEVELSRAARHEIPVCVALVDVDHFKSVNDSWGHGAGDAALRVVAQVLRRSLRRSDLVGRWGGEEFAIAFPETRVAEAFGKLEQLRMDIASHTIVLSTGGEIHLTISGGIAASRQDGTTVREILSAADSRLLAAKRSGRNRIHADPPGRKASGDWRAVVQTTGRP